jgi:transcriptional regulator with XRE-family HTH domain
MRTTLALNIKNLREKKNMTQEALGKKTGVGTTAVSQWETGKSTPRGQRLYEIASALDVSIEELMNYRENEHDSFSVDTVEEPATHYDIATDLELRIESVEKRLNLLSHEIADLKKRYEKQNESKPKQ